LSRRSPRTHSEARIEALPYDSLSTDSDIEARKASRGSPVSPGRPYALGALGVSAADYETGLPGATIPRCATARSQNPRFKEPEKSSAPVMIRAAAEPLLNQDADLWAAGKLDWN
jgi:hypothetical protein